MASSSSAGSKSVPMDTKDDTDTITGLDDDVVGHIILVSQDGEQFKVPKQFAFISRLVKESMEEADDSDEHKIPLPSVKANELRLIVEYMQHHKGVDPQPPTKPLRAKEMEKVCEDKWDAEFIDNVGKTRESLHNIILAANYMHISSLLGLACAKTASITRGQPLKRISDILDPKFKLSGDPDSDEDEKKDTK